GRRTDPACQLGRGRLLSRCRARGRGPARANASEALRRLTRASTNPDRQLRQRRATCKIGNTEIGTMNDILLLVQKCAHTFSFYDLETKTALKHIVLPNFPHEFTVDA